MRDIFAERELRERTEALAIDALSLYSRLEGANEVAESEVPLISATLSLLMGVLYDNRPAARLEFALVLGHFSAKHAGILKEDIVKGPKH